MFKITTIVTLLLIGMLYAAKLSCESCGGECVSSCGSRRFRACCFNYLRRKRGEQIYTNEAKGMNDFPGIVVDNWPSEFIKSKPYSNDDVVDYRLTLL